MSFLACTLSLLAANLACASSALAEDFVCGLGRRPFPVPVRISANLVKQLRVQPALEANQPFDIVIVPGPGLAANPAALAAFQRAAAQWERRITDPIVVTLEADLGPISALGGTVPTLVSLPYADVVAQLKSDANGEARDAIVANLPSQLNVRLPAGFQFDGEIIATKANLKALGLAMDTVSATSDATITFNSNRLFDFDNRNGVAPGATDFESVAAHEIGHALGFFSAMDLSSFRPGPVSVSPLDLFRFQDGGAGVDPTTPADFATFPRLLVPGVEANLDETRHHLLRLSTRGDGNQASHWKDDALLKFLVGIMDPTENPAMRTVPVAASDLLAMDLIGYEINVGETNPLVTRAANGAATSTLKVASGANVLFNSTVSDADGLGFPALFGFAPGRVTQLWDFPGAVATSGELSAFAPNPLLQFNLAAGEASRTFKVAVTGFDSLGDRATLNTSVLVVPPTPPTVTLRANGQLVTTALNIKSGNSIQFDAIASDVDGLGYPVFNGFGNTGKLTYVWTFDGATPAGGDLAAFIANPQLTFTLAAGQTSRTFRVVLAVFDALGASRNITVTVNVTR